MLDTADEVCKTLAVEKFREGAWAAAASTMTDEEVHDFVTACLAEARRNIS